MDFSSMSDSRSSRMLMPSERRPLKPETRLELDRCFGTWGTCCTLFLFCKWLETVGSPAQAESVAHDTEKNLNEFKDQLAGVNTDDLKAKIAEVC